MQKRKGNTIQSLALNFIETKSELAFKKLMDRLKPGLTNHIYKYVKDYDTAQEIANASFTSMWKNIDQYKTKWHFSTWAYTIAKHEALNTLRTESRYLSHEKLTENHSKVLKENSPQVFIEEEVIGVAGPQVIENLHEAVLAEIQNLEEPYRSIMIEREINHKQQQHIAEDLDMNLSTVKTRLRKARADISAILTEKHPSLVKAYFDKE